jgi:hypothetical protein
VDGNALGYAPERVAEQVPRRGPYSRYPIFTAWLIGKGTLVTLRFSVLAGCVAKYDESARKIRYSLPNDSS